VRIVLPCPLVAVVVDMAPVVELNVSLWVMVEEEGAECVSAGENPKCPSSDTLVNAGLAFLEVAPLATEPPGFAAAKLALLPRWESDFFGLGSSCTAAALADALSLPRMSMTCSLASSNDSAEMPWAWARERVDDAPDEEGRAGRPGRVVRWRETARMWVVGVGTEERTARSRSR
jgi:hypothetical protein